MVWRAGYQLRSGRRGVERRGCRSRSCSCRRRCVGSRGRLGLGPEGGVSEGLEERVGEVWEKGREFVPQCGGRGSTNITGILAEKTNPFVALCSGWHFEY